MKIEKPEGYSDTEKLLGRLSGNTFQALWAYLNVCKHDGDELCDAIAVFENHVFLFFDKKINSFDNKDKKLDVLWNRWKKKAIDKQIKTANYAEIYILKNKGELFLDSKCEIPFPLKIPQKDLKIHKIIIAHGASEMAQKYFGSTTGSLQINYTIDNDMERLPFCLSLNREDRIHVFDSGNLELIFNELDTFFDFSRYILAKEEALEKYQGLSYASEEDLLAHYFNNYSELNKKHFIGSEIHHAGLIIISEGEWAGYSSSLQYSYNKEERNRYVFWDKLIEHIAEHHINGTSFGDTDVDKNELPIYHMAKEPRFVRTTFSKQIVKSIENFPDNMENTQLSVNTYFSCGDLSKMYVFIQFKGVATEDEDAEFKRTCLVAVARLMKIALPRLETIVGISIYAPKYSRNSATDSIVFDCRDWDDKNDEDLLELNKKLKLMNIDNLRGIDETLETVYEFQPPPTISKPRRLKKKKIGRNDKCPCESGLKYKRCCGKS